MYYLGKKRSNKGGGAAKRAERRFVKKNIAKDSNIVTQLG